VWLCRNADGDHKHDRNNPGLHQPFCRRRSHPQ